MSAILPGLQAFSSAFNRIAMKKLLYILAGLGLAACTSDIEELPEVGLQPGREVTLTGISGTASRTQFVPGDGTEIQFQWSTGDRIWAGGVQSAEAGTDGNVADFGFTNLPGDAPYRIYYNMTGTDAEAVVPTEQRQAEPGKLQLGPNGDFGYATTDSEGRFTLSHATAYVWFNPWSQDVKEKLVSVTLAATDTSTVLTGTRTFDGTGFSDATDANNAVTLSFGKEGVELPATSSTFLWTLRRPGAAEAEPVGDEAVYEFCEEIAGTYEVSLRTENEDGSDEMTIEVEVVDALAVSVTAVPIGRKYDGLTRTVSLDRTITLRPFIWNGTNPKFSWTIDGQEVGTELSYTYTPTETGIKKIVFTVTDTTDEPEMTLSKCITRTNETRATLEFTVECHSEEESHRRPASGASSATWDRVYEYTPAPGQFINELVSGGFTGTETSPEAAVAYAEERMKKNTWVSLGGWGGYIVVGFDHSIDNSSSGYKGGYNFSITGNAFKGSSEPGIVYVMQDTNGNTLPDDEWYELKGSEYGKEETVQDYAVTYYRPTYSGADVQWKDNQGVKGKIDYLKQYHDQPSYYPAWIGTDSYTLYGPCLKSRTYDQSGNGSYWVNGEYDWGYADNFGNDRLSEDDNAAAGAMKVYFKISNAVDKNGQPANLKYIDFIRVQTGVNAKAGWLGENSTEVFGFTDENINQGK